ncbi:Ig-like domain-containing protein [Enterobacter cloacae]|nr:Ig-like domain-containing protein [Enterobacter cloacae]
MHVNKKLTICLQVFFYLHFTFCNAFLFSFPAHAETNRNVEINTKSGENNTAKVKDTPSDTRDSDKDIAGVLSGAGSLLSQDNKNDAIINSLINSGSSKATNEIQQWLQQFGTARVNIGLDQNFSLESANLDLLLPLYDDKGANLLFTQLGGRREDDRNIFNAGLGYRYFADSWMWGVNAFYDQQVSGNTHQRMGVGGELGWDYLKLSANGYKRLSGWKTSSTHQDYEERVADGYDVRTEGYLPVYPQLGAKLVWEQYYGDDVALFGDDDDDRQKNPYAVTAGINFTPFPLISFGLNQKMGKGDHNDTQVEFNVNWMPGVPIATQLDSEKVKERRTLLGSRMDLVNRNNNIVLEYRKQDLISLSLPEHIEGVESKTVPVTVNVKTKYPVDRIVWQDDNLVKNGGKISEKNGAWFVVLPHYVQNGAEKNSYVVAATAYDNRGNKSDTAHMTVAVNGFDVTQVTSDTTSENTHLPADSESATLGTITASKTSALANGQDAISLEVKVEDANKNPVKGATVDWSAGSATANLSGTSTETNALGIATIEVTSANIETLDVTATMGWQTQTSPALNFTVDSTTAVVKTLNVDKSQATANNNDRITLTAEVVDASDHPVPSSALQWSIVQGQGTLSATQNATNESGRGAVTLTATQQGTVVVSVNTATGTAVNSPELMFIADTATGKVSQVTTDKTTAVADGKDKVTYTATVTDANGNPLQGIDVNWNVTPSSAKPSSTTSRTGVDGTASVSVTTLKAGDVSLTAQAGAGTAWNAPVVTFTADSTTAQIGDLSASKATAVANGVDSITFTGVVTDKNGNPVSGEAAAWSVVPATGVLSATTSESDAQGNVSVTLKSDQVADYRVKATVNGHEETSDSVSFTADTTTAAIRTLVADRTSDIAAGSDTVTLTATVLDDSNHPVPGATVSWSSNNAEGVFNESSTTTDAGGITSVTYSSILAMPTVVTAKSSHNSEKTLELTIVPDLQSAIPVFITASKYSAVANGDDNITLAATVKDKYGNVVTQGNVGWQVTPAGNYQLSATEQPTDDTGKSTVTLASTDVVTCRAVATFNGFSKASQTMRFAPDQATEKVTQITANKTTGVIAGKDIVTLQATVMDEYDHPIDNAVVHWGTDNDTGVFAPGDSSTTNSEGVAEISFTATKAQATLVGAGINHSQQTMTINYIGNADTATLSAIKADKSKAVADNAERVTWSATVKDVNGNLLPGVTVNWRSNDAAMTLSGDSSVTDANGIATVSGTTTKAGDVVLTATLVAGGQSLTAAKVSFIGDVKTAELVSLNVDKSVVLSNGVDAATYTVEVKDANQNLVPDALINWQTTMNTLSAASTKTDASGVATAKLSGHDIGMATVTASINNSTLSNANVKFINTIEDTWVINSDSSNYSSAEIKGFPSLGFVTVDPTNGPTQLEWAPGGYSAVSTPVILTDGSGQQYTVNLKGYRTSDCSQRPLNAAVSCAFSGGMRAKFTYARTDNPDLPAGHYTGLVHFLGKDWHTSYAFEYKLTLDLTVN